MVVWLKVTVERRGRKKGPSLAYRFQRSMESGDSFEKEAPPCDPKSINPTQKEQSKVIYMVVDIEPKDGLKRHAVMVFAKKLAWHVKTYSTIELTIFIFCYVLLWF